MNALRLAKRRVSRRRREAGAALFIVAMTLAVLASLGIYALAATQNEVRTSGNERQNTQTHYLAEYGVLGAVHEISATKAQLLFQVMMSKPDYPCVALPSVPATAGIQTRACRRMGAPELGSAWTGATITDPYGGTVAFTPNMNPGSLGPTPMNGNFFIELTDPMQRSAPTQYALNLNMCFIQLTVTSTGITQPVFPGNPTAAFGAEGLEMERARIVAGPIQCPNSSSTR
jgi:hypothetical protein